MHPSREFQILIIQTLPASASTEEKQRSAKVLRAAGSFLAQAEGILCSVTCGEEDGNKISRARKRKSFSAGKCPSCRLLRNLLWPVTQSIPKWQWQSPALLCGFTQTKGITKYSSQSCSRSDPQPKLSLCISPSLKRLQQWLLGLPQHRAAPEGLCCQAKGFGFPSCYLRVGKKQRQNSKTKYFIIMLGEKHFLLYHGHISETFHQRLTEISNVFKVRLTAFSSYYFTCLRFQLHAPNLNIIYKNKISLYNDAVIRRRLPRSKHRVLWETSI